MSAAVWNEPAVGGESGMPGRGRGDDVRRASGGGWDGDDDAGVLASFLLPGSRRSAAEGFPRAGEPSAAEAG